MFLRYPAPNLQDSYPKAYQYNCLSWNMKKAGINDSNQWTLLKNRLELETVNNSPLHEIAALQNCDMTPHDMKINPHQVIDEDSNEQREVFYVPLLSQKNSSHTVPYLTEITEAYFASGKTPCRFVYEYQWIVGKRVYFVYHMFTSSSSSNPHFNEIHYINLAIVSCYRADEVILFEQTLKINKSVLGIRIGTRFFFNVDVRPRCAPLEQTFQDIEMHVLSPRKNCGISCVVMGTFSHKVNITSPALLMYIRHIFSDRVHPFQEVYTFIAVGDEYQFSKTTGVCETFDMDRAYYKPIFFWPRF